MLAKCLGSTNPYNVVRATINGLQAMNTPAEIAAKRGKTVEEITGISHGRRTEKIKVTLVKSPIGTQAGASRDACAAWACGGINQTVEVVDTPAVRGMINKVSYLREGARG